MNVLDVYARTPNDLADQFPEDAKITHTLMHEIGAWEPNSFDVVVCQNALQTVERDNVPGTVAALAALVKPLGELWLITPSLDWVIGLVNSNEPNKDAIMALYGPEDCPHRSAFMLGWLRKLVEMSGMVTRRASQMVAQQGEVQVLLNAVIALKVTE